MDPCTAKKGRNAASARCSCCSSVGRRDAAVCKLTNTPSPLQQERGVTILCCHLRGCPIRSERGHRLQRRLISVCGIATGEPSVVILASASILNPQAMHWRWIGRYSCFSAITSSSNLRVVSTGPDMNATDCRGGPGTVYAPISYDPLRRDDAA